VIIHTHLKIQTKNNVIFVFVKWHVSKFLFIFNYILIWSKIMFINRYVVA
jgi:hypothetical protein